MSNESQNTRVLRYLKCGNKINPLEAWRKMGIYRLSGRIYDLREQGYNIRSKRVRRGAAYVAEYSLP